MELSRCRIKGNSFAFMTDLQFFQYLFILFGLFNLSVCLFEDQIGKFDWRQNYVGKLKFSQFDTVSTAKRLIVVTEENVVAALHLKTGQIIWRQVLENGNSSQIEFLHVDSEIVTVQSMGLSGPYLIRGWEPLTGGLLWEWTFTLSNSGFINKITWLASHGRLYHIVSRSESSENYLEVTSYNLRTGQNKGVSVKIPAKFSGNIDKCVLANPYYVCIDSLQIYSINVVSESNLVHTHYLKDIFPDTGDVEISVIPASDSWIHLQQGDENSILLVTEQGFKPLPKSIGKKTFVVVPYGDVNALVQGEHINDKYYITGLSLVDNTPIQDISRTIWYPNTLGDAKLSSGFCNIRKDRSLICRFTISTEDEAIALIQNEDKLLWVREESLGKIAAVDLLDLPVSDLDASIEKEFDNKGNNDIVDMVTRRLTSQFNQLQSLVMTVIGLSAPQSKNQAAGLVRDEFGLHKMIVISTQVGKIFGVDNKNGEIRWTQRLQNVKPFESAGKLHTPLFVQRTTRHFPHAAQCALFLRDSITDEGVLFMFNPITGSSVTSEVVTRLGYQIKQIFLLPEGDSESLRGLLVLDSKDGVHVMPSTAVPVLKRLLSKVYLFTADVKNGVLSGYKLIEDRGEFTALQTWNVKLNGHGQRIIDVVQKNPLERVHSQGRVLGDRSVLFKYINPNLVAVGTQAFDPIHKYILNIYLIDTVSGVIVFSVSHKRAKGPIHIVHSENWLTYTYFNEKWRRTEIASLELYEGKEQSNETEFSSLSAPKYPYIERQAFIMPATILTMKETITEKGITSKHVLMALSNGGILEMPWIFLDPRRPVAQPAEEGVVPYMPELPVPSEAILNYNQTLARVRGIHTVPSGLESTSLVFVYGLDLFYTRIAPSKTFDVLKDDFDYYLISIMLVALTAASYITRHLASRKALKQAWH